MEDEMNRFRGQLLDREKDFFSSSGFSRSLDDAPRSALDDWVADLKSPLVHDSDDGKQLKLRFDVSDFKPEEIVVKTVDNRLQVSAKHEAKDGNNSVYREYNREFLLPKGTISERIRSSLSKDGVLTVEAPLPALDTTRDRKIPITHR
eukprot:TRINITY_DN22617_c0_g1_i1.p2 TRINITY_DN22617_c0_g1~~TRINITY_DN22617_c0_g1_i1.p2  ORF type:complete len:148 (-),score=36.95 TRINITY_DN22617_c0_g1_i1:46-489(-)